MALYTLMILLSYNVCSTKHLRILYLITTLTLLAKVRF